MSSLRSWCLTAVLGASCFASACARTSGEAPCVVLVLVDTLRRDALGCYGGAHATPALDELAARGTRFEQAISSSGWTLPAAASILTGVAPPVHQALGKVTRLTPISPDVPTGAELLSAAGVRTLAFTNAAFVNPLLGLTRGFEQQSHHHAYNQEIRRADATVDAALAALADDDGRAVFCFVHLFDAHLDYDPPGAFARLYTEGLADRRRPLGWADCSRVAPGRRESVSAEHVARVRAAYEAEVAFVDAEIGRFVRAVRALRRGPTLFVVTADHGEEFWDHGAFEHGHSLYDELVRVPLLLDTHPQPLGGGVVELPVRTLDVLPTVLDFLALPPAPGFEGSSLLPVVRGEDREPRSVVLDGTLYGHDRSALRTERHKLILDRQPGAARPLELYDWSADPREERDLASSDPETAARLRAELEARLAAYQRIASGLRPGVVQDLSRENEAEVLRQLDSLGYSGD